MLNFTPSLHVAFYFLFWFGFCEKAKSTVYVIFPSSFKGFNHVLLVGPKTESWDVN